MKFLTLVLFIAAVFCLSGFAQNDYNKKEFFVGYSNGQQKDADEIQSSNGFTAAGVYHISRYFGFRGDFSGTYGKRDYTVAFGPEPGSVTIRNSTYQYNFLVGLQVKDNASTKRLRPFGYALAGVGHSRFKSTSECTISGLNCSGSYSDSRTGFAAAIGGGLDIKINKKIDFRAIQVDYNPMFLPGGTQHGARIGIGIVFK